MLTRTIISVLAMFVLSACASNPYKIDRDQVEGVSTVKGYSERDGLFTWLNARIETIDNKTVTYVLKSETDYEIPITPEKHKFVILTEFNNQYGGACPCQSFMELEAEIQPDKNYGVKAKINGANIELWIEDLSDSTPITDIAKSQYFSSPRSNYVPIIIH